MVGLGEGPDEREYVGVLCEWDNEETQHRYCVTIRGTPGTCATSNMRSISTETYILRYGSHQRHFLFEEESLSKWLSSWQL